MPRKKFWNQAGDRLRPRALATVVDFGEYLMLWATVAGAHFVRVYMESINIDSDFVEVVAQLEKWVFLASFVSFFWRILIRLYNSAKEPSL
jgi:hypothetical protein